MKPTQTQAGLTKRNDPILGRKRNKGRLRTTQPQTHHTVPESWRTLETSSPRGWALFIKSLGFYSWPHMLSSIAVEDHVHPTLGSLSDIQIEQVYTLVQV